MRNVSTPHIQKVLINGLQSGEDVTEVAVVLPPGTSRVYVFPVPKALYDTLYISRTEGAANPGSSNHSIVIPVWGMWIREDITFPTDSRILYMSVASGNANVPVIIESWS